MEEDTNYRIRFSSLWFTNERVGFQGTIRSSLCDFIIIEMEEQDIGEPINKTGKIPELNNFA